MLWLRLSRMLMMLVCVLFSGMAYAQIGRQTPQALYQAVDAFLAEYAQTLTGEVQYDIGAVDSRTSLPACPQPTAELARNSKPWGRTRVAVYCNNPTWTIYVPVTIRMLGEYPVAARALKQGDVLTAEDIRLHHGDLSALPQTVEMDINQLIGKRLSVGLSNGQPFRKNMVKAPLLVRRGQNVNIQYEGGGFSVTNTGQALSDGGEGDLIGVRTTSGQVIRGVVHADGTIRVR